jgi:hypothetical protein
VYNSPNSKDEQKTVTLSSPTPSPTTTPSPSPSPSPSPDTDDTNDEECEEEEWKKEISLEYYQDDTSVPLPPDGDLSLLKTLEDIKEQCINAYKSDSNDIGGSNILRSLSIVRIYNFSDRDEWFVITGDSVYGWPGCYLFTYRDGNLLPFVEPTEEKHLFSEPGPFAEEIRIINSQGFPNPILELFSYSHQGNGHFALYSIEKADLVYITSDSTTGSHFTSWEEMRQDPIFDTIPLEADEYFDCFYENGHLAPVYTDINEDDYVDVVLQGNFQCVTSDYKTLLSQPVKKIYLYDEKSSSYVYHDELSVHSPLADFWYHY